MCGQVFPNPMHNHQRIACGPVTELLQEFIKGVVVSSHTPVGIGQDKILEKPGSLGQEINPFNVNSRNSKPTYEISDPVHTFG